VIVRIYNYSGDTMGANVGGPTLVLDNGINDVPVEFYDGVGYVSFENYDSSWPQVQVTAGQQIIIGSDAYQVYTRTGEAMPFFWQGFGIGALIAGTVMAFVAVKKVFNRTVTYD
tara:strand:- start:314 stop:655 length:342 start_codon:yes stop_codon:yes gene_type:complete